VPAKLSDAATRLRQFFGHDHHVHDRCPFRNPFVFLVNEDPKEVGLRQHLHHRPGEFGVAVVFRRYRADFLFGNLAGEISNGPLIFSESIIHKAP
jgi:hypothetical protein